MPTHGSCASPSVLSPVTTVFPSSNWLQTFQVAGLCVTVSADDEGVATGVNGFARAHWLAATSTTQADVHIVFQRDDAAQTVPTEGAQLKLAQGVAYVTGQTIHIVIDGAALVIPPTTNLQIHLPANASTELISILFAHALHAALRRHGWFELHAACAAEPHSHASFFFVGDSGCGKTTLAMRLAAQGWRYLTDDSLLLNETLTAKPLRRLFALTPQTLAACAIAPTTHAEKQAVEPAQWFGDGALMETQPRSLVFPTLTQQAESEVAELTQATALMRLLRQSPWACFDPLTGKQHLHVLTRLARSTPSYELRAGRDLLEVPDAAAHLLGKLV